MCARWNILALALALAAWPARADDAKDDDSKDDEKSSESKEKSDAEAEPKAARPAPPPRVDMTLTTLALTAPSLLEGELMQIAPVYEQVRLSATGLKGPGLDDLQVHVSGWAALNAGQLAGGDRVGGDFAYAYAQALLLDRRLKVRLGRQLITGGVSRLYSVDGLQVTADPTRTFGAMAYGGLRVLPGFAASRSDSVYGARAYWRPKYGTEIGASWTRQYDEGRLSRSDVGADGRWQASRSLAVQGALAWGLAESRLVEGLLGADWRFAENFDLWLGLRRTAPDLFLSRASIFSVFSMEQTDEATAQLAWSPSKRLRLRCDWSQIWTDTEQDAEEGRSNTGFRSGLRATANPLAGDTLLVGVEARRLSLPTRGYWQARLFGMRRIGDRLFVSADLDSYWLDVPLVGDQTHALTGVVTGGMEVKPGLRLMLAGLAGSTPLYASRYEFTARLAWDLSYSSEAAQ